MASFFNFLGLPPELRTDILRHLVVFADAFPVDSFSTGTLHPNLAVFLVNLQLYREATELFYAENNFLMDVPPRKLLPTWIHDGGFLTLEALNTRRRIRKLTLDLHRVGGLFEGTIAPVISDMLLGGTLKSLKICLDIHAPYPFALVGRRPEPGADQAPQLMRTDPWQALFRLLDDPDLEHVELWAGGVHYAIWCPFHDHYGDREKQDFAHPPNFLACIKSLRWVKMDCRALVGAFSGTHTILRVGDRYY